MQGKSDLAFDLFCNPDTYDGMTAFLPADLEKIKAELVNTFESKDRFNQAIAAYIKATTENHRRTVRPLVMLAWSVQCLQPFVHTFNPPPPIPHTLLSLCLPPCLRVKWRCTNPRMLAHCIAARGPVLNHLRGGYLRQHQGDEQAPGGQGQRQRDLQCKQSPSLFKEGQI